MCTMIILSEFLQHAVNFLCFVFIKEGRSNKVWYRIIIRCARYVANKNSAAEKLLLFEKSLAFKDWLAFKE